ncbi:MAG: hypothetical protein KDD01_09775, partial [Phaeodactylibacter sp.]|nr:hypothetical protein [Phaeodactylibacter sp.]
MDVFIEEREETRFIFLDAILNKKGSCPTAAALYIDSIGKFIRTTRNSQYTLKLPPPQHAVPV